MLLYLNGIFVGLLILSNILAVKLISIGNWIVLPAAVIIYVFTYPITDVIGEVYGKEAARKTVMAGLITQIFAIIFIMIAIHFPPAPFFTLQQEYEAILSGSFRITLASLTAYVVSQHLDVIVFHRLKQRHGEKKLWLRNNVSTSLSQLVDTTIFIVIAFEGVVPISTIFMMIGTQYLFKFIVALLDTPLVYLLVYMCRHDKVGVNEQLDLR